MALNITVTEVINQITVAADGTTITVTPVENVVTTATTETMTPLQIGLGNVDNTSDLDKPISTATQTALDLKSDITHNHDASYAPLVHTHVKTDITDFSDTDYATAAQGVLADSALQDITGEAITDLSDVVVSTPANTEVLTFNGTNWVNSAAPAGVTDHTLLTNIGTNTHAQIDTAVAASTSHIADATIHYPQSAISITESQISDLGNYEPADPTILKDADIGVNVEAYDPTILKVSDIGVNVQAYDATILVDADIGVNVAAQSHTHEGTAILATAANANYVLTADGAGNAVWQVNSGGTALQDITNEPIGDLADVTLAVPPTGRYWKLSWADVNGGSAIYSFMAEMELRLSVGGTDETNPFGTITASNNAGGSETALIDNDLSTAWGGSNTSRPHSIVYDFGVGVSKAIAEVQITSIVNADPGQYMPTVLTISVSDDNVAWTDVKVVSTGSSTWASNESRQFSGFSSSNPLLNGQVLTFDGTNWINNTPATGVTDHTLLTNIGTNTHAQIDSHIADGTIHYAQSAISITESQISDLGTYEPAFAKNTGFNLNLGTTAGTVTEGNDARLSDARTPLPHTHVEADITDLQPYLLDITNQSINDLNDVLIATPSNGQVLTYDTTNGWQNVAPVTGVTDHTLLSNIGTNTHAQIDTHIADATIHYPQSAISITESQISDLGTYEPAFAKNTGFNLNLGTTAGTVSEGDHLHAGVYEPFNANIQAHISDFGNPHVVALSQLADATLTVPANGEVLQYNGIDWVNVASSAVGITDHTLLSNIGTNTHAQIDSHIADGTVHYPQSAISITESQISDLGSYQPLDTDLTNIAALTGTAGFLKTDGATVWSVDASSYSLTTHNHDGVYEPANANIQAHIADSTIHYAQSAISITESQISDLGAYLTVETNDLTTAVVWANVPDVNITQSSVTQHQAALTITESQISDLGSYSTKETGINNQTGTAYTPVLTDSDDMITMNNAAANTVTIPANATVAYPIGTKLNFMQLGAGATSIAITTDTLNVEATLTLVLNGQYSVATALKVTSTSWVLFGNLVPV